MQTFIGAKLEHIEYSGCDEGFRLFFDNNQVLEIGFSGSEGIVSVTAKAEEAK